MPLRQQTKIEANRISGGNRVGGRTLTILAVLVHLETSQVETLLWNCLAPRNCRRRRQLAQESYHKPVLTIADISSTEAVFHAEMMALKILA